VAVRAAHGELVDPQAGHPRVEAVEQDHELQAIALLVFDQPLQVVRLPRGLLRQGKQEQAAVDAQPGDRAGRKNLQFLYRAAHRLVQAQLQVGLAAGAQGHENRWGHVGQQALARIGQGPAAGKHG